MTGLQIYLIIHCVIAIVLAASWCLLCTWPRTSTVWKFPLVLALSFFWPILLVIALVAILIGWLILRNLHW